MTERDELTQILDRVVTRTYDSADVRALRQMGVHGNRNAIAVGDHSIALSGAKHIQIGDSHYYGADVDAIRAVVGSLVTGEGSLRGLGGVITTLGLLIAMTGMGMFFYGLLSSMANFGSGSEFSSGPPPIVITGFAVAACGVGVAMIGGLIRGWSRRGRR